jgi:hypothetical protein
LEYLLFVVYLVFFAWLVTKVNFFRKSGLSQPQLIILFLLKVMAGIFYGWIGLYYGNLAQMVDTWSYHTSSIEDYHLLKDDPYEFFSNLFRDPYHQGMSKFLDTTNSYWNDLKSVIFIKLLSIFNIFSFGHYYVNVIFYSFISMFGPIAVFRIMTDAFPGKRVPILLASFLVPSFLYWTSGLHKEGLIFTGIALLMYCIYFGMKEKSFGWKRVITVLLGLLIILVLRNFLIIIIVPAILAWILSRRWPERGLLVFSSVYLLFIILFFTVRYISPRLDFPEAVVIKQQEFIKLKGSSSLPIKELQPNAISFLKNTPQAINLSSIRPYPSDVKHILSLAAAIEVFLLFFILLIFLIWRQRPSPTGNLIYFCLFFSFSLLLTIGFSVNNLGAIVRYRSIILPLLVIPMVAQIDWKRLGKLVLNNIKNKNNIQNSPSKL